MIGARVDRLPDAAKSALEAASVLGDPITRELIAAMQGVDLARAEELLGLCLSSGLLTTPDQARSSLESRAFVFRHALVRDVVLGTLTRGRLKALHRLAFLALHSQPGAGDADAAPALAHHAFKGEEWEHAARFAVKSMARAISRSANQEALQLFEMGVEASRRTDGEVHCTSPGARASTGSHRRHDGSRAHRRNLQEHGTRRNHRGAIERPARTRIGFEPDGGVSLDARAIRAKVYSTLHGAWTRPALRNGAT